MPRRSMYATLSSAALMALVVSHSNLAMAQGRASIVGLGTFGGTTSYGYGVSIVSNGAQASFFNAVVNNGELRVPAGGAANFFGLVSGAGSFTGTGQSRFEGGFSPGNSRRSSGSTTPSPSPRARRS